MIPEFTGTDFLISIIQAVIKQIFNNQKLFQHFNYCTFAMHNAII